jgi:tetratricopeptide (TPR) repeat protein
MIGKTVSHYKIIEKIGEGGMGVVYKAHHTRLDKVVALKFLPSHLSSSAEAKTRFIHEAKTASALDHPNICTIHDIDESPDGGMFIAMAHYEGETLRARLERGPLEVDKALDIVAQIVSGLSEAHDRGIVHRDVKPANILITKKGEAKILDFGLAKLAGRTKVTKTGSTIGTVSYMSPEQARGEDVDARSDIFSLGSVMYEVLTGHPPFPGDHDAAILYRIVNEEPAPLSRHRPSLPSGLQGVIERTLQKKASERYSSMTDLLGDLRAIQAGVATSPGIRRRRKIGARTGMVAAMVLVAIGGYLGYQRFWPTPKHPAAMFRDKTLVVAVTPFWGQNAEEVEEGRVMQALIERQLFAELGSEQDVKILGRKEVTDIPRSHDEAKALGRGLGASVVLWGEVLVLRSEVEIQPYMTVVRRMESALPAASPDAMRASLSESNQLDLRRSKAADLGNVALLVAGTFYRLKDPDKALSLLQRISPPTAMSLVGQGRVFSDRNDWAEAERMFRRAIELDSTDAYAHTGMGGVCFSLGKYDEARVWYEKAIDLDPRYRNPYAEMGRVCSVQGNYDEAIPWYQKAIDIDPDYAYSYYSMGDAHSSLGKYDEAILWFRKAIDIDPNDASPYFLMGLAHDSQGEHEEAITWFQKAIDLDPAFANPYLGIGYANYVQAKYDEAITWYRKAIDLDPGFAPPYSVIGSAYVVQRKYDEAITWYRKAIDLDPSDAYSHSGIASACMGEGKYDEAITWYRKAIDLDPSFAYSYSGLASAYVGQGKYDEAITSYRKAIDLDPRDLHSALWYFVCLQRLGKTEDARRHIAERARTLENDDWVAPVIRFYNGDISEGALLKHAAADDPKKDREQTGEAYYHIGLVHLLGIPLGEQSVAPDTVKAIAYFEKSQAANAMGSSETRWAQRELDGLK